MDFRKNKEIYKNFNQLFSGELKDAEERLFKKMKDIKETRKKQILDNMVNPNSLDEEDEEDKLIKDFIRQDKIKKKLFTNCEFWLFLDILFASNISYFDLYYQITETIDDERYNNFKRCIEIFNDIISREAYKEQRKKVESKSNNPLLNLNLLDNETAKKSIKTKTEIIHQVLKERIASGTFIYFSKFCYRDIKNVLQTHKINQHRIENYVDDEERTGIVYKLKPNNLSKEAYVNAKEFVSKVKKEDPEDMVFYLDLQRKEIKFTYLTDDEKILNIQGIDRNYIMNKGIFIFFMFF